MKTYDTDKILSIATAVLGGLAIILGVVGFAMKESVRVAGGAAILGGGAIAFQFAALASLGCNSYSNFSRSSIR